jgi:hypothetical protein
MPEEGSKKPRTVGLGVFLGVVVILAVLVAGVGYFYYSEMNLYNDLQESFTSLFSAYSSLNYTYSTLSSGYSSLNSTYGWLLANYTALSGSYNGLIANMTDLNAIAHLQKTTVIANNQVMDLPANGFDSLQCQSSYAGYLRINFVATKPISFLITNLNHGVTYAYPVTGIAASGNFIAPILDGSNFVDVFAPTTSGVTVTINATLYY